MFQYRVISSMVLVPVLLFVSGCGSGADRPPLGYVSGTVTMDGEPVSTITVVMKPDVGRPAIGVTDAKGKYDIEYTLGEKGTKLGPTTVGLEWPTGFAAPFGIPDQYIPMNSSMKLDVQKGKQTFDIQMESAEKKSKSGKPIIVD